MTFRNVVCCLFIPVMACAASELRLAPPAAGADAVPLLREAIRRCKAEGISRLVLEKGIWHLYPERAYGMYRHVSNHDACYRRIGIWLEGMKDFDLDGQGSTLLSHGVLSTIAVDRSERITLRNFTVDWDKPFHLEGTTAKAYVRISVGTIGSIRPRGPRPRSSHRG
jgi:hypothetical protein